MSHGIETEVPDVGLFGENEPPKQLRGGSDHLRLGIDVDGQVDRFKEDCILSVVVLHILSIDTCTYSVYESETLLVHTVPPLASLASSR